MALNLLQRRDLPAPRSLKRRARVAVAAGAFLSDPASLRRFASLERSTEPGEAVEVRVRQLGGRSVWLRPGTSDSRTLWETFVTRYHLPPRELARDSVELILDLGANIGVTMAHLAVRYPRARVVGVELDADNAELARRNTEPWVGRCEVVEAGVWHEDGELWYHKHENASGYNVLPGEHVLATARARAVSLDSLVAEYAGGRAVDYLKMDIEGSEQEVLERSTGWADRVRCIKVETHFGYTREQAVETLRELGFDARLDRRHWAAAVGMRLETCYTHT